LLVVQSAPCAFVAHLLTAQHALPLGNRAHHAIARVDFGGDLTGIPSSVCFCQPLAYDSPYLGRNAGLPAGVGLIDERREATGKERFDPIANGQASARMGQSPTRAFKPTPADRMPM